MTVDRGEEMQAKSWSFNEFDCFTSALYHPLAVIYFVIFAA